MNQDTKTGPAIAGPLRRLLALLGGQGRLRLPDAAAVTAAADELRAAVRDHPGDPYLVAGLAFAEQLLEVVDNETLQRARGGSRILRRLLAALDDTPLSGDVHGSVGPPG